MKKLIGISEAASLAIHTIIILASQPGKTFSNREMAAMLDASPNHLAKVLQRLNRHGFVKSIRGPRGGFGIGDQWSKLRFMDIYEAIDGPWKPQTCLLAKSVCTDQGQCPLSRLIININKQMEDFLRETSLGDITNEFSIHINQKGGNE